MAAKKKFSELSPRSRALVVVGAVIQLVLQGVAVRDIRRRPADQIRGPKQLWMALSFLNYGGPIAYFVIGRKPKG